MDAQEVDQMKNRLVYLLFPTVTLLLGLLPGGTAVVNADPGGHYETLYPYFALTPVLAGEPVPLIVALSVTLRWAYLMRANAPAAVSAIA